MKTLTADSAKRVRIPDAKPHQVYAYECTDGRVTLTPVKPAEPKPAKLVRRNGRSYLVSERTITDEDVRRAMDEFP